MTYMTLTPAYGRDYKSAKDVKADWDANKDFVIADIFGGNCGLPVNKEQLVGKSITVNIRYANEAKVTVIKVG